MVFGLMSDFACRMAFFHVIRSFSEAISKQYLRPSAAMMNNGSRGV